MCISGESVSEEMERIQDETASQGNLQSPVKKAPESPEKKKRKTKAELKEELTKQKVMEKKAALRRQRTRNKRSVRVLLVIDANLEWMFSIYMHQKFLTISHQLIT